MSAASNQTRCVNCGRTFSSQANYCPRCGRSVRDAAPPVMAAPLPLLTRRDPIPAPPVQQPIPATPKKKQSSGCGGCGCFIGVLLIILGIGWLLSAPSSTRRKIPAQPSPPANVRPPRAPNFRSPPVPMLGMSGSWVSIHSVVTDAVDSTGRVGYRMHGRVHSTKGARLIIAAYLQRSDGIPVYGTDPMYRDDANAAGVATTLTMPQDDLDFTLFLPHHAVALTSSSQPLWVRPCLFEASSVYHFSNGTPLQFWPNTMRKPTR